MESNSRVPVLKGRPFFEQLRLSINFIDSNMKLIDNSVKTSNTDEEYNYVKSVLGKAAKYNDDVNAVARCIKMNNVLKRSASEFEDEVQNLKEMLRCKEIDYGLEPFKYPATDLANGQSGGQTNDQKQQQVQSVASNQFGQLPAPESRLKFLNRNGQFGRGVLNHVLNSAGKHSNQSSAHKTANGHYHTDTIHSNGQFAKNRPDPAASKVNYTQTINLNSLSSNFNPNQLSNKNKCSSIKKKDTFLLKDGGPVDGQMKRPESKVTFARKDGQRPKESQADLTSESIDPSNQFSFDFKLPYNKLKNNYYPSSSNFSVDESLEIEFTPGLKSRRTCKKPQTMNESNASVLDLQTFDKRSLQLDNRDNSIRSDLSLIRPDRPAKHEPLANKLEPTHVKPDGHLKQEDLLQPATRSDDKENHQEFAKHEFIKPEPVKSELNGVSPARHADKLDSRFDLKAKSQKLATPKKPPNFDFLNF